MTIPNRVTVKQIILQRSKVKLTEQAKETIIFLICLINVFLFLYTAYSKIMDHQRFAAGLSRIAYIGKISAFIAWTVPILEILISILLIIPYTFKWGLYCFTGLMAIFTGYILSMVLLAKILPCHCGGVIEKLSWTQHIWFNLAFIAIAMYALWLTSKTKL